MNPLKLREKKKYNLKRKYMSRIRKVKRSHGQVKKRSSGRKKK